MIKTVPIINKADGEPACIVTVYTTSVVVPSSHPCSQLPKHIALRLLGIAGIAMERNDAERSRALPLNFTVLKQWRRQNSEVGGQT